LVSGVAEDIAVAREVGIAAATADIGVVMGDIAVAEGRAVVGVEATEQVCLRRVLLGINRL